MRKRTLRPANHEAKRSSTAGKRSRATSAPALLRKTMGGMLAIIALLAAASCAGEPRALDPVDLLVIGGTVVHPDGDQPPKVEDIAIRDGRIVEVGPELGDRYDTEESYDASGRFVIPGLADLHSHFGNGILPEGADETELVLGRHLYFGNTTILNLGSASAWPEKIDQLRARMAEASMAGPRLLAVGALITMPGSHPTTTIYSPEVQAAIAEIVAEQGTDEVIDLTPLKATSLVSTPEQVAQEVRRLGEWGADAIKIIVESGPGKFGDDHPQMTPAMIAAAAEAAAELGVPLICHVSSVDELEACVANGAAASAHGVAGPPEGLPDGLEQEMVDAGFAVIPTAAMFEGWIRYPDDPSLLDQPPLDQLLSPHERQLFGSARMLQTFKSDAAWVATVHRLGEHLHRFHELGGRIVAGTDTGNPYRFAGFALHEELAFYVKAGLSPREALATATVNAAAFVGAEKEWGAIRPGLAADLVVLEESPLEDIEHTRGIVDVIQAGRAVEREALPLR